MTDSQEADDDLAAEMAQVLSPRQRLIVAAALLRSVEGTRSLSTEDLDACTKARLLLLDALGGDDAPVQGEERPSS